MTGDPEGTHEHYCNFLHCGRSYVCPNDRCPGNWICPVCQHDALDLYIEALQDAQLTQPTQEQTHNEKH